MKIVSGEINRTNKIYLERGKSWLIDGNIKSMRHGKEEITQAKVGTEFGLIFSLPMDFKKGDFVVAWH